MGQAAEGLHALNPAASNVCRMSSYRRDLLQRLKGLSFFCFPSKTSFASLTLVATYWLPPKSGWFAIMILRCASFTFASGALSLRRTWVANHATGVQSTGIRQPGDGELTAAPVFAQPRAASSLEESPHGRIVAAQPAGSASDGPRARPGSWPGRGNGSAGAAQGMEILPSGARKP